jgi:hypothetical protein
MEAATTIAVGTVLAGVAIHGGLDAIDNSKIEAAKADVAVLGQATLNFFQDNAIFPLFKNGLRTGADDEFFTMLVSENGTYPSPDAGDTWQIGSPAEYSATGGKFGHQPAINHDTIEGHLVRNIITNNSALSAYPVRGLLAADVNRGWHGPYVDRLPRSDPWGDKYMINVQEFSTRHVREFHAIAGQPFPRRVVVVLSAGPNRQIETPSEQLFEAFEVRGDDIAFRIR